MRPTRFIFSFSNQGIVIACGLVIAAELHHVCVLSAEFVGETAETFIEIGI